MPPSDKPGPDSALNEIRRGLDTNERNLRAMICRESGVLNEHFDPVQATTLLCICNCMLNLSWEVRKMADLLEASESDHTQDRSAGPPKG